jgi:hypothetical protein
MVRIVRIAVSLAIVMAAYAAYSSFVVPAIEPPAEAASNTGTTADEFLDSDVSERVRELAPLFPPDSWQVKNPKILDNDQNKLLFQEYINRSNGEVELHPCTIVYDPGGPSANAAERIRRCVVIDAPGGAILRFNKPLQLGRAEMGHLTGGRMLGPVTIRSDGRSPGPEDDLRVSTTDVQLSEREIWTTEVVDFRLGGNYGRGKEMHIRLAPGDDSRPSDSPGLNVGGLESFELSHIIDRLHLEGNRAKTSPAQAAGRAPSSAAANANLSSGPMEISCHGPLQFDMARQEATFRDRVNVWQIIPNSQSDQLTCELLTIHFAPKRENPANPASKESDKKKSSLGDLEPQWIRAEGEPVVFDSQFHGVQASGQQLEYDIWTGSISLESTVEAWMRQGSNEIHSPSLKYQPGPPGRLGQVVARGPGWFRGQKDAKSTGQFEPPQPRRQLDAPMQPQQVEARFRDQLLIRPQQQNDVVSLIGDAGLRFPQFGELTAHEIHVWLTAQPQQGGPNANKLQPDRMLALHEVRIHSPQLDGVVEHFEAWFEHPLQGAAPGDGQPPHRFEPTTPLIAPPLASHLPYLRDPWIVLTTASFPTAGPVGPNQHYQILGRLMRVRLILRDDQPADLAELMVQDGVRFQETQTAQPGDRPMLITGDRIHAIDPNGPRAIVTVVGRLAHFEGRALTLDGPNINLDRGANRLWVEGPGQMVLPVDRDLEGHPLPRPGELSIGWHKRMTFDGVIARFESDNPQLVSALSAQGQLQTQMLEVHLRRAIRFDAGNLSGAGQGQAELSKVFCRGGANLDSATFDPHGQVAAQRLRTADLSIDMVSGALNAAGPGWLNRVAHGSADSTQMMATPGTNPKGPHNPADDNALACLAVRFEGSLDGNFHNHESTFHDQVRAARAPVDRWDATIDPDRPERLDPRRVLLRCDHLWVAEMPTPVENVRTPEMQALGSAVVDAQTFTARALRISYVQAKDLLTLEGDGWTDAELFRQLQIGGATNRTASQRIEYRPKTQELKLSNAHNMDFNAIPAGKGWK